NARAPGHARQAAEAGHPLDGTRHRRFLRPGAVLGPADEIGRAGRTGVRRGRVGARAAVARGQREADRSNWGAGAPLIPRFDRSSAMWNATCPTEMETRGCPTPKLPSASAPDP